jgi:hypothetical protein
MVIYDKLKNFGKIIKNSYGHIIPTEDVLTSLKTGTIAACFHKLGKVF